MQSETPRASGKISRRILLLAGLVAVPVVWSAGQRAMPVATVPLSQPAGFRGLRSQQGSSGGRAVLLGLGPTNGIADRVVAPQGEALCAALFDGSGSPRVAVFTDAYCPFCRRVEASLARLASARPGMTITFHDWPRLSQWSGPVARVILAAGQQRAEAQFRARVPELAGRPQPGAFAALARSQGLDSGRLLADMDGPEVAARLARAEGLASAFGVVGTPVIVAEDIVIHGAVPEAMLARVLRDVGKGPSGPCA
jgi:protein-disulfide isomerase